MQKQLVRKKELKAFFKAGCSWIITRSPLSNCRKRFNLSSVRWLA